ncbi:MAG: hypothetical protein RL115_2299, partial [Bacteroidota bacterium]
FTAKKITWDKENYKENKHFKLFLKDHFKSETLQISRQDCFNSNNNFYELLFKTILWGYPQGMRGNSFQTILTNLQTIKKNFETHTKGKNSILFHDFENLEKSLRKTGIGLSTLTKLLYFIDIYIDNFKAVIFDSRIIEVLQNSKFEELKHLADSKKNTISFYNFSVALTELFNFDCKNEQIEHFLFAFGLNLKD